MTHPTRTPRVMNGQSRTADKFVVRLEDGLRDRIAVLAHNQGRSMNSYVVRALSKAASEDESGMTSVRPLFSPNTPCRFRDEPFIVIKSYFSSGELVTDIVNKEGEGLCVGYGELQPY